jgi:hypothetical protein
MSTLSSVDGRLYHKILMYSAMPNITNAIQAWQERYPDRTQIVGDDCEWGMSLGGDNLVLGKYLSSTNAIKASSISEFPAAACEGSEKALRIFANLETHMASMSVIPHPLADADEPDRKLEHQSKAVIIVNYRLERAILYEVSLY